MESIMAEDIEMGPFDPEHEVHLMGSLDTDDIIEERVSTSHGRISVGVSGDRKKPAIITFHDLGLNANSCFQSFFQFSEMAPIGERFCVYHINAPGQEEDASVLPENFTYPTVDELSQIIVSVVKHFNIRSFIGFGVGIGANILLRYSMNEPKMVDGLILINCVTGPCGWIEWAYQKVRFVLQNIGSSTVPMNMRYLTGRGMTTFTLDYLMWHHFGRNLDSYSPDLVNCYRQYFARLGNPSNLAAFIQASIGRSALNLSRETHTLSCPVLQVVGAGSPYVNDSVDLNGKLDPAKSDWMKVSSCSGLVLEERPDKVAEAVLLFLQGLGHFPTFNHLKWVQSRREQSMQSGDGPSPSLPFHSLPGEINDPVKI